MIESFTLNHYGVNSYVVYDSGSRQCALIDPAAEASYEEAQVKQFIEQQQLTPRYILLTHAHVDHIAGLRQASECYHLPVTMHPDGTQLIHQAVSYASIMGFEITNLDDLPTCFIQDNEILPLGQSTLQARYVPGHCPGSMCYVSTDDKCVITGDALFHLSVGRTDLPGGDHQLLIANIKDKLLTLPDEYSVLPGHGIRSTIGKERLHNPFL
ncbi:MAG: MBL fold metallo-hydrolase [Bacteroidales bacterium]|nr:MBL fold metallo-hydrolase [Candidatus Colimorpha onthohippi]